MGIWTQAREMAAATPAERNRYVDFLRALSIGFVIIGHWLMTTAHYDTSTGELQPVLALDIIPWTAWLTWMFQVMPIFFIVGGYSNAISLEGANKKALSYAQWLTGRLHRLLTPLLLLILVWAGIAFALSFSSLSADTIRTVTRTALVPTWFLAIYTMIVLLAPLAYKLWQRWGFVSLFGFIAMAVIVDMLFLGYGLTWSGWSNYFWVWLAMHHLGFAWRDERVGGPPVLLALSALSLAALYALITYGPYPIAMAGSPGDEVSNTLPPKITLIALGLAQFGLLIALEKPMQRWLQGLRAWTVTVLVNSMIMTVYLWHMTILIALMACAYWLGGIGLTMEPGAAAWWWSRPLWLVVLSLCLVPIALALSPLERLARPAGLATPSSARLVGGAMMAGLGLSLAAMFGLDGNLTSVSFSATVVLVILGAGVCGVRVRAA